MRNKRVSKGKSVRPTFFVFCEGKSEEAYVKYLRSHYRLPIKLVPNVTGTGITNEHIKKYKLEEMNYEPNEKDRDYLMYDCDREDTNQRLKSIHNVTIISSNPCIEIWFLLHFVDQKAALYSDDECNKKL